MFFRLLSAALLGSVLGIMWALWERRPQEDAFERAWKEAVKDAEYFRVQ